MLAHIRACLWLLVLTVLVCCVVYPLALWAVGRGLFPQQAEGSLVRDERGEVRGSRLIAQKFSDDRFFQPRPSAVDYNASASGGSNLAASNPLLRDRVARQLGPVVRYDDGRRVGPDIEKWFRDNPGLLGRWAEGEKGSTDPTRVPHPKLAARWVKDDANKKAVLRWLKDHPDILASWRKEHPDAPQPDPEADKDVPLDDVAVAVLTSFAAEHPDAWPVPRGGRLEAVKPKPAPAEEDEIKDLQAVLFDAWLQAHPDVAGRLRKVPADMVTTSGSGLDPHITLSNARWQLKDHVAGAWAKATRREPAAAEQEIDALLQKHAFTPSAGLAGGEPLVNVLELNLELAKRSPPSPAR